MVAALQESLSSSGTGGEYRLAQAIRPDLRLMWSEGAADDANTYEDPNGSEGASAEGHACPELRVLRYVGGAELTRSVYVVVQPDDDAFLARTAELPQLYGFGDTANEAFEALADEIASLWEELSADDKFTDDWLPVRERLAELFGSADEE